MLTMSLKYEVVVVAVMLGISQFSIFWKIYEFWNIPKRNSTWIQLHWNVNFDKRILFVLDSEWRNKNEKLKNLLFYVNDIFLAVCIILIVFDFRFQIGLNSWQKTVFTKKLFFLYWKICRIRIYEYEVFDIIIITSNDDVRLGYAYGPVYTNI